MDAATSSPARILSGASSRFAAMQMALGNMISMQLPPPLRRFGGSTLIHAMHRHHPNPRVGYYTQHAACRFCAVMGAIIPVGTFFPGRGIMPWSLWSIARIRREEWPDIELPETNAPAEES